ncbi:MAG: nucleotidyltransferase family protein [Alphaproteobacteria bacterium]
MALDRRSVEFRVIALAVRTGLGLAPFPDDWLEGKTPDWSLVLAGAKAHRVAPLVADGLASVYPVPPPVAEALARMARQDAVRCLALVGETLRFHDLFAAAGIRGLVLKGVVLSQSLHGDPARRSSCDVDVWIDPARIEEGHRLLIDGRYLSLEAGPPEHLSQAPLAAHHWRYRAPSGVLVELHQDLFPRKGRFDLDFATAWKERQDVMLGGVSIPTLPAAALPVYLCAHGAYHRWRRLFWLADMAMLLRDEGAAAAAVAAARPQGLAEAMMLAVSLTHLMFGVPEGADPPTRAAKAIRFANSLAIDPQDRPPPRGTRAWFREEMRERIHRYTVKPTARHVLSELVADLRDPVDRPLFNLPHQLAFLYPLLRPVGWVRRNFHGRGPER